MNHKGSINLLALKGAQILNVTLPNGSVQSCIVIPAAYNDMLRPDRNNPGTMKISPYVNFRTWPCHQKYVEACLRNHAGEDNYIPPTHSIKVSFSEDFRTRATAAAERRIRNEKPDITDDELKKAVAAAVNITLGDLTPTEPQQRSFAPTGTVAAAPAPDTFNTPTTPASPSPTATEAAVTPDDLPF